MKHLTGSNNRVCLDLTSNRPALQADVSKYVNTFEAAFAPFFKNAWLSHEKRAVMLDNIMRQWVLSQRYLLVDGSPSFHQMLINEGYIDETEK